MKKQTIEIEVPDGKKTVCKDGKVVFEDIEPQLWMGKPELNEKMRWVSRSDTVHFLCDDFYNGNRNLFENYNLNPRDFADMKEGEIREVFINLED